MLIKPMSFMKAKTGGGGGSSLFSGFAENGSTSSSPSLSVDLPTSSPVSLLVAVGSSSSRSLNSATIDGVSATVQYSGTFAESKRVYVIDTGATTVTGGAGRTVTLNFSGNVLRSGVMAYDATGLTFQDATDNSGNSVSSVSLNHNTSSGDSIFAGGVYTLLSGSTISETGLEFSDVNTPIGGGTGPHYIFSSSDGAATGGTPESFAFGFSPNVTVNAVLARYA